MGIGIMIVNGEIKSDMDEGGNGKTDHWNFPFGFCEEISGQRYRCIYWHRIEYRCGELHGRIEIYFVPDFILRLFVYESQPDPAYVDKNVGDK